MRSGGDCRLAPGGPSSVADGVVWGGERVADGGLTLSNMLAYHLWPDVGIDPLFRVVDTCLAMRRIERIALLPQLTGHV